MTTINNFSYLLLSTSFVVETDCVIPFANNYQPAFYLPIGTHIVFKEDI